MMARPICLLMTVAISVGTSVQAQVPTRLPTTRPGTIVPKPVVVMFPTPCDSVRLYSAQVVRNNKPAASYFGAPTYSAAISLNGTTWMVRVPIEAYDLQTPYLVRFMFSKGAAILDHYHPALSVLTKDQALSMRYLFGSPPQPITCFIKVSPPSGTQLGSTMASVNGWRNVTDDWPGEVPREGQYALELWYFSPAGVLTKYGDYAIRLSTCPPSATSQFHCA